MTRKLKIISILCVLLLLSGMNPHIQVGFAEDSDEGESEVEQTTEETAAPTSFPTETEISDIADMKLMASNSALELYFNEDNAEFAVKEKKSGYIWYSNPADRANDSFAEPENKGLLSAQIALTYFNPSGQTTRFDTYKDSVSKEQFEYEQVENGFKVVYTLGSESKGLEQIPQKISEERFQTLILDKSDDEKSKSDLKKRFKFNEEEKVYERRDNAFSKVALERALKLFEEVGYTEEDVAFDNEEHGAEGAEGKAFPSFTIPLLVQLDEDELIVTLDGDELEYDELYPISEIQVLPFFGAANQKQTGYIFIPDGSGALIDLNNGKGHYQPFSAKVYGRDDSVFERNRSLTSESIRLPVFGMKQGDHAFFSVIEEADGIAKVQADVSGRVNSYNSVSSAFVVKEAGEVTLEGGNRSNSIYTIQKGDFNETIKLRYAFLDNEKANYAGMASYYQQYLVDKYNLEPLEAGEDIPFYLELSGSIWKRKTILGIPYKSLQPLTTFAEGEEIVNGLLGADVKNLKLRYTGWFNEGINHKIPTKISIDRTIGGKKGLNQFSEFLENNGVEFYPDVALANVYRNTLSFSPTRDASRYINKKVAELIPVNPATYWANAARTPYYLLSPTKLPSHVDGFMNSYEKFDFDHLALRDLGERIHSDFREKNVVNREQSKKVTVEQLSKINKKIPHLMATGGNEFILPYVKSIVNTPLASSGFNIADRSVPFYQMVIHGYIDYAGQPVNLAADQDIKKHTLKALETGSNVYFNWFYADGSMIKDTEFNHLISANYKIWLDDAIQMYDQVNEVLKQVRDQSITSHKELAAGVYETTYGDDYSIVVNYNEQAVSVDGMTIEAENYKIRQGE